MRERILKLSEKPESFQKFEKVMTKIVSMSKKELLAREAARAKASIEAKQNASHDTDVQDTAVKA